jgi:WD40 repeat protein
MSTAASKGGPMLTKSGYLHKRSFKNQHKDVVNCFVVAKTQNAGGKGETEYLFTGSSDTKIDNEGRGGNIIQWVLETSALVKTFDLIDPEQEKLEAKGVNFFGVAASKKPKFGHREGVTCLAVCKGFLYSGSFDKRIIKWDIRTHTQVTVFEGHSEAVYRLSVQDIWLISVSLSETYSLLCHSCHPQ